VVLGRVIQGHRPLLSLEIRHNRHTRAMRKEGNSGPGSIGASPRYQLGEVQRVRR